LSRGIAAKHAVKIYPTVRDKLTLGGNKLAVDAAVLIGEHGDYPTTALARSSIRAIGSISRSSDVSAHPATACRYIALSIFHRLSAEAKQMYDEARESCGFRLWLDSSLPVSWSRPPLELEMGAPWSTAVTVFYGRQGGVRVSRARSAPVHGGTSPMAARPGIDFMVRCVEGPGVRTWTRAPKPWAARLLDAALGRSETKKPGSPRENVRAPILFRLLQYRSGLAAAVYILNGHCQDCTFAADNQGQLRTHRHRDMAAIGTALQPFQRADSLHRADDRDWQRTISAGADVC